MIMDEDEVVLRLTAIVRAVDAPPVESFTLARAAFETLRLDQELAELVADSFDGTPELVRAEDDGTRLITFQSAGVTFDLEIQQAESGYQVRGLVSGATGTVEVEGSSTVRADPDPAGWFVASPVPAGPVRIRLLRPDAPPVVTSWVTLPAFDDDGG